MFISIQYCSPPVTRQLPTKATFLVKPDFKCNEMIVKWYHIVPSWDATPLLRPYLHHKMGGLIRGGLLVRILFWLNHFCKYLSWEVVVGLLWLNCWPSLFKHSFHNCGQNNNIVFFSIHSYNPIISSMIKLFITYLYIHCMCDKQRRTRSISVLGANNRLFGPASMTSLWHVIKHDRQGSIHKLIQQRWRM
jgi:hypothetical protein